MTNKLAKSKNELNATGKPSSQDLVLARMLDLAAQITRQEVQPGEVRFWQETFATERPEMLERAFREYLRKAKYFPKPGDIQELIDRWRNEMAQYQSPKGPSREETEREQSSPEWQEASRIAREKLAEIAKRSRM